jgi:hypothetical protein
MMTMKNKLDILNRIQQANDHKEQTTNLAPWILGFLFVCIVIVTVLVV